MWKRKPTNPNLYPYNVFRNKEIYPFVFAPITIFYGNNGSGKSTLLNLIASKIKAGRYAEFTAAKFSMDEARWQDLENVRYFYEFFKMHEAEFE
jgi:predicted ATPase